MEQGPGHKGPVISTHHDKEEKGFDANNLPYLHKSPAVW